VVVAIWRTHILRRRGAWTLADIIPSELGRWSLREVAIECEQGSVRQTLPRASVAAFTAGIVAARPSAFPIALHGGAESDQ
jgi:hypothetical protein